MFLCIFQQIEYSLSLFAVSLHIKIPNNNSYYIKYIGFVKSDIRIKLINHRFLLFINVFRTYNIIPDRYV